MKLYIKKTGCIKNNIEKEIKKQLIKEYPTFFFKIKKKEIKNIKRKIKEKFNKNISSKIICSIKSLYTKNHIIKTAYKIKFKKNIIQEYNNNIDIINLSKKYKLSPLNILLYIFKIKYNCKIKYNTQLNDYDNSQFKIALKYDYYNPIYQQSVLKAATNFENKIEEILINRNIQYKTQITLAQEQILKYGRAINTPDFLITSELYINDIKINWIDAKNFYGANIDFIKKKIVEQETRYLNVFGSGCLIFHYGYNKILLKKKNNILYFSFNKF